MKAHPVPRGAWLAIALLAAVQAFAADFPAPKSGTYVIKDFRFQNGQVLPELKLFYQTVGEPTGQPLDASKYYLILPDAIGTGRSSKPSDGLRMNFPRYNYDDMVEAQHRLVREHLGVKHLRLVIGNSMGGMQTWMWAQKYPGTMDVAVPMASLPTEMSGRNWMLRRMLVEAIRRDPAWNNGNYTTQPPSLQFASVFFATATNGGNHSYMKSGPNRARADAALEARLKGTFNGDANDHIYQWESSADYNPSAGLEKITATLLAINSADDERNPVELGILEREIKRVKNGRAFVIPTSEQTLGHGTTANARFWKQELEAVLKSAPRLGQ